MIEGSCHCGDVKFAISEEPKWLTTCNCSICRRLAALWGHIETRNFTITAAENASTQYIHGDKTLAFHSCNQCGCTTHWENLNSGGNSRMAVNFRMCSDDDQAQFTVRHFDGADTWEFVD